MCLLCVFVVCLCVCVYTRVCVSALMCALCMCMCVCICPYSVIRYVRVGVDVYTTRTTEVVDPFKIDNEKSVTGLHPQLAPQTVRQH